MEEMQNTVAPENAVQMRRKICMECTHLQEDKVTCGVCLCPLVEKATYLPQQCPLGKWGNGTPEQYKHLSEAN